MFNAIFTNIFSREKHKKSTFEKRKFLSAFQFFLRFSWLKMFVAT